MVVPKPMLLSLFIICILPVGECFCPLSSIQPPYETSMYRHHNDDLSSTSTILFSSSQSSHDDSVEETLMKISLSINEGYNADNVISVVQKYLSSFPFSAVLPVQPLTYTPKKDNMGVDVSFLRKKTEEKSSKDGGIEFILSVCMDDEEDDDQKASAFRVNIVAKRVSEGQVISKVFSEGMIIKSFINGISNGENDIGRVGIGYEELLNMCSVESIFHKWM